MEKLDLVDDELGRESAETDINLDVLDLEKDYNEHVTESVDYPILLIDGLDSEEEFRFFKNRPYNEECALPLYCMVERVLVRVGMLDLVMESLLLVRFIANYRLFLLKSHEQRVEIFLNDPDFLSKFIKL